MLTKRALSEHVQIELLQPGDRVKTAAAMPEVQRVLDGLKPEASYTYALVNAMGYSEFYGTNSNADWYGYHEELDFNGLLHAWPDIGQDLETDRMKGRDWPYGYPSFYNAAVFAHHRNSDPVQLGFGDVRYVFANPEMKRIELLMRVFNEEARKKGHLNIVERIRAGERVDVSMGCKICWDLCLAPDMLVRTPQGYVRADSVAVGQRLLTHKGRYREVKRVFQRDSTEDVRQIKTVGTPPLMLSDAHPLLVVREEQLRVCKGSVGGKKRRCTPKEGSDLCGFCGARITIEPKWVAADQVRVGDYLVTPRTALGNAEVAPSFARTLGYYLGDGYRIRSRLSGRRHHERVRGENTRGQGEHALYGVGFTVGATEEEHTARLWETLERLETPNSPLMYEESGEKAAYRIYLYDRPLAERLIACGGHGSRGKRLAEEVFTWPREALLELLAGWIDTDGSYSAEKDTVRVSTVNRGLVLDMQRIALALGIPAPIGRGVVSGGFSASADTPTDFYFLFLTGAGLNALRARCAKLHGTVASSSRKSQLVILEDRVLFPVRVIERVEEPQHFVNFSIDEDESYVAEGVATHNCSVCTDWDAVRRARLTFDPVRHKHWGLAVLEQHKKTAIRGLAVTSVDYCSHIRSEKNRVYPDGRKAFMHNVFPRFFDISCVFIGADRTARVMWHLADGFRDDAPIPKPNPIRLAQLRLDELFGKTAELEKEIPDGVIEKVLTDSDTAPEIRFDLTGKDPKGVLSSAAALGMVLSPTEFSRLVGGPGTPFSTATSAIDDSLSVGPSHVSDQLLDALTHVMPLRSAFRPFVEPRITTITACIRVAPKVPEIEEQKLAALYNGYRLSVLEQAEKLAERAQGYLVEEPLGPKVAAHPLAALLLGMAPVVHLVAAHLRKKQDEGQQLGTMASFLANNPTFLSLAALGAGIRVAMAAESGGLLPAALRLFTKA